MPAGARMPWKTAAGALAPAAQRFDLPIALLERLLPSTLVACVMVVDEAYDQTPGPGAGAALRTEPS